MTTQRIYPNATISATGTLVGGATAHAVLSDSNVTTYLQLDNDSSGARVRLGTFTLGAGEIVVAARATLNFITPSQASGAVNLWLQGSAGVSSNYTTISATTTDTSQLLVVTPDALRAFTQAEIDDLCVQILPQLGTGAYPWRAREVYVDVTVASPPTCSVTSPTGTIGTSTPTVTWTYAKGSDGGVQSKAQVKIFTAAQFGAGGFNPETSSPTYDSGVLTGTAVTHTLMDRLTSGVTYRAYVKVAHTINGQDAYSAWQYSQFTTSFSPAQITSVTLSPNNSTGAITVTVNRNTGTAAWETIEVMRSDDGGMTYVPVRGATGVGSTNTWMTTWGANSAVVVDYEAPNGVTVQYIARASRVVSGEVVTGSWTTSSTTLWSSTSTFIKDPLNPAKNATFRFHAMPTRGRRVPIGVNDVIGRSDPVVIVDARKSAAGTFVVHTSSAAAAAQLDALAESATWLIHAPQAHSTPTYVAPGDIFEVRPVRNAGIVHRYWEVNYVGVARPGDST